MELEETKSAGIIISNNSTGTGAQNILTYQQPQYPLAQSPIGTSNFEIGVMASLNRIEAVLFNITKRLETLEKAQQKPEGKEK